MKKTILNFVLLIFLMFTFSSCYTTKYFGVCKFNLNKVENLTDETDNSINIKSRESLFYKDSIISIQWTPKEKEIDFVLENLTNSVITIDWNNVVFYDLSGKSCRTMHSGVKYIDRNSAQPSSTIIPKSKLDDMILPTDNVYFKEGTYSSYGSSPSSWESRELFSIESKDINLAQSSAEMFKNKDVKILMPITYKNKTINYVFNFNISDVTVSHRQEYDYMSTYLASLGISTVAALFVLLLVY
jgi:hypothetical protein